MFTHSFYTPSKCPLRARVYDPRVFRVLGGGPGTGPGTALGVQAEAEVQWILFTDSKIQSFWHD